VFRRRKVIAASVEAGALKGPKAVRRTMRAVYGEKVTKTQLRTSATALREGADRIAGKVTVDHVSLSKRIRKWDRRLGDEMAHHIERGIKTRKGIEQIAKKIERLDNVTEGLPKYLQQVEDLARKGGGKELKALAKRYAARAKKLMGEMQADGSVRASAYSLRSPTSKFLRDIQKAGKDGVDNVVKMYVEERAAWRAKLIARHETVEAYRRSYVESSKSKPGVYAFEWKLSNRHPVPDICDVHAHANYYGLGPGRYPGDRIPERHPSCICSLIACVDRKHFEREESDNKADLRDHKSPDGVDWLKQNQTAAAAILGPTRMEAMRQGVPVLTKEHQLIPVGELVPSLKQAAE
jgi:hypothetical protein